MVKNHLKISWWLTWGNLIITSLGFGSLLGIGVFRESDFSPTAKLSIYLLFISWVSIFVLQNLPKWYNFCCNCCQTKCFPVFEETILDVNRSFEVVEWPINEHDGEELEVLGIRTNETEDFSEVFHSKNESMCISCKKNLQPLKRTYTI